MEEDLTVKARIDDELSPGLENIREDLNRVGDQATTSGRRASSAGKGWATFGKVAKGALIGLTAAVAGTVYATSRLIRSSISEAREAEKIGRTTAAIIKATGGAANVTGRQVAKLTERLSVMAGVDDELIQAGANLLLTFKNVRNEAGKSNKVFDRATAAALDLSAAGFGSVESGSKMLGKALNDPLKGITALSRAGVTFSEGQVKQIEQLVKQNDLLGAQKVILGEVESQVGGVAKAQATFGDRATVVWGNVQEKLGTALLPMLDRLQRWFVEDGGPALERYVDVFERKGIPALKRFGTRTRELATDYLPKVKDTLADVRDVIVPVASAAKEMVDAFLGMPSWAKKLLIGAGVGAVVAKKLGVPGMLMGSKPGGGLLGMVTQAKPLPVFVTNPGGLGGGLSGGAAGGAAAGGTAAKAGALIGKAAKGALIIGIGAAAADFISKVDLSRFGGSKGGINARLENTVGSLGDSVGRKLGLPDIIGEDTRSPKGPAPFKLGSLVSSGIGINAGKTDLSLLNTYLDATKGKAAGLGRELDLVGARKLTPRVNDESIRTAKASLVDFIGKQIQAGRPVTPYITLTGYERAMAQIATMSTAIRSIPSAGMDNGATYIGRGAAREYGGSVKAGVPYVVGERRAELFVPDRAGTIIPRVAGGNGGPGSTVTIERIEVNNPTSDVDVERAVRKAIDEYVRDREERT